MNREQQLKLQAFLDGELPEREKRAVLLWLQDDHAAAALLAELKNTRQALVNSETPLKAPETREFFWSKIEREILRQNPRAATVPEVSIFTTLRRRLLPLSAVAVVLIAAMIANFNAPISTPKVAAQNVADNETPSVETMLADGDATTYHDASEGTTLVWFSNDAPARAAKPPAIN